METRAQLGVVPRAVVLVATLALLTALAAGAIVVGSSGTPNLPAPFGAAGNGLIAFVSDGDVHVVEPDGSGLRPITSGPGIEYLPTWSRDGTKLAFWSWQEVGPADLVVVDADGGNATTVASTTGLPYATLEWSVDGTEILFGATVPELVSDDHPCNATAACGARLFIAATDGSGWRQVGDPDLTARLAVLSPDGHTVAFGGGGEAGADALYLMEWDGSDVRRLETGIHGDAFWAFSWQSWSPTGDRLVTHTGTGQLWVVDLDDTGALESAKLLRSGYFPGYAPVGSDINDGDGNIFADDQDGPVAEPAGFAGQWSPDATQLVRVGEGGNLEIYDRETGAISVIGTVEVTPRLTEDFIYEMELPSWQRIAP
jgi:dipeptidyl aminopeptidase/acylaminoacyl peptidase